MLIYRRQSIWKNFFELYEKGKQMDWIIEDLVELYEEIRQEKSWDYERMLSFEGVKDRIIISTDQHREKQGITSGCST